jgi:hypothetical protein
MTQAGNLRNHADDCTTDRMNTRAVQLGKILSLWGPDGVGHSPSDPSRPKRSGSRLSRDRVCRETESVERQGLSRDRELGLAYPPGPLSSDRDRCERGQGR